MKKLLAIALLAFSTTFGHADTNTDADKVNLENLIFVGTALYSPEVPIPVIFDEYDTNGDGLGDIRAVYQITPDGRTRLIEKDIDRNKNGIYDESERYIIVDLEKEFRERKLKELLDQSKSFQKSDYS